MKKILIISIIFCAGYFGYSGHLSAQVDVKVKPVDPKVVIVKPAKPGPHHVWIDG